MRGRLLELLTSWAVVLGTQPGSVGTHAVEGSIANMSKQLLQAAERADIEKVKELIAAGADVTGSRRRGPGRTALIEAALRGQRGDRAAPAGGWRE